MKYRLLILAAYNSYNGGVGATSQIVEFESKTLADAAHDAVVTAKTPFVQTCIKLY